MGQLIDARTAAARLGVDIRTLYAYVSRGALRRVPGPDGRSSRYDADELDLLARRSRPRTLPRPGASIDLVIATQVSTVTDGLVRYRGTSVLDLVATGEPFEAVAARLWADSGRAAHDPDASAPADGLVGTGAAAVSSGASALSWVASPDPTAARIARALGDGVPVVQRFAAVVASMAGTGGAAADGQPLAPLSSGSSWAGWDWPAWGRALIAALVEASGSPPGNGRAAGRPDEPGPGPGAAGLVAWRLWQCWSPLRPTPARTRALNTALVLLAEHELALSTLAVRVAASARAAPSGCLLAGLGVLSGTLHGDAARLVQERLFGRAPAERELGIGFGHSVHRHGDPRTAPLLDAVVAVATPADRDLIERARRDGPAPPNVDFALGALAHVARMPPEAATGLFAVARTAGWIAHAAEEYTEPPLRFRGRAVVPGVRGEGAAWR